MEDLLQRYGEDLTGRASDAARDVRSLLELEGQGRLLQLEAGMDRLHARLGRLEGGLERVAAAANTAAAAATEAAAAAATAAAAAVARASDTNIVPMDGAETAEGSLGRSLKRCRFTRAASECLPSQVPFASSDLAARPGARADALLAPVPCGPIGVGSRGAERGTGDEGAEAVEAAELRPTETLRWRRENITSAPQGHLGGAEDSASHSRSMTPACNGIELQGSSELLAAPSTSESLTARMSGDQDSDTNEASGTLQVMVVSARGLPRMDVASSCDPYCILFVQGPNRPAVSPQVTRTSAGRRPTWEERFSFDVSAIERKEGRLVVAVWDHDVVSADDLIGSAHLDLANLAAGVVADDWFPLRGPALQGRSGRATAVRVRALFRPRGTGAVGHHPF